MAVGIIPARYASSRFPGKSLALLAGQPIIKHVYHAACRAESLAAVWIATDDRRILNCARAFGARALLTSPDHACGTDRLVEALGKIACPPDEIIVNIQGDEPLLQPADIDACVGALASTSEADWATLVYPLAPDTDGDDPNLVKVVRDLRGFALYFSRLPIPCNRDEADQPVRFGHAGLYAYRAAAVLQFAASPVSPLERAEKLEQLRALELGMKIICVEVEHAWPGVDTPADLQRLQTVLAANPSLLNLDDDYITCQK